MLLVNRNVVKKQLPRSLWCLVNSCLTVITLMHSEAAHCAPSIRVEPTGTNRTTYREDDVAQIYERADGYFGGSHNEKYRQTVFQQDVPLTQYTVPKKYYSETQKTWRTNATGPSCPGMKLRSYDFRHDKETTDWDKREDSFSTYLFGKTTKALRCPTIFVPDAGPPYEVTITPADGIQPDSSPPQTFYEWMVNSYQTGLGCHTYQAPAPVLSFSPFNPDKITGHVWTVIREKKITPVRATLQGGTATSVLYRFALTKTPVDPGTLLPTGAAPQIVNYSALMRDGETKIFAPNPRVNECFTFTVALRSSVGGNAALRSADAPSLRRARARVRRIARAKGSNVPQALRQMVIGGDASSFTLSSGTGTGLEATPPAPTQEGLVWINSQESLAMEKTTETLNNYSVATQDVRSEMCSLVGSPPSEDLCVHRLLYGWVSPNPVTSPTPLPN